MEVELCFIYSSICAHWTEVQKFFLQKKPISYWEIEAEMGSRKKNLRLTESLGIGQINCFEQARKMPVFGLVVNQVPQSNKSVNGYLKNAITDDGFVSFFDLRKQLWRLSEGQYWLDINFVFPVEGPIANIECRDQNMGKVIF